MAPSLIEKNLDHLTHAGPDNLLVAPNVMWIDNRLPALGEGALWPEILRLYTPAARAGPIVVLKRRAETNPAPLLGPSVHGTGSLESLFPVPQGQGFFVRIKVKRTVLGLLASVLFRPSGLLIHLTYDDGSRRSFRFIRSIAEGGFILSPYVETADDFTALALGNITALKRVVGFSLTGGSPGWLMYRSAFDVEMQPLVR